MLQRIALLALTMSVLVLTSGWALVLMIEKSNASDGSGSGPVAQCSGDTNGDGRIDIADAVRLMSYLFDGGAPPVAIATSADSPADALTQENVDDLLALLNVSTDQKRTGVITTPGGGIEDADGYLRTISWDMTTGIFEMHAEHEHGLDLSSGHDYWWCTIGTNLGAGDIRAKLELAGNDDSATLASLGFVLAPSLWWAYRLEDITADPSPFTRIRVLNASDTEYHDVLPSVDYPVTGWIYGPRTTEGQDGPIYVAVSATQMNDLNVYWTGEPVPFDDNSVIVDLGMVRAFIGQGAATP